jgi:hypothetical protein
MAKNDIWLCKDGTKMKMCEMSDRHLKNSINYFIPTSEGDKKSRRWKLLKCEARRRKWKVTDKDGVVPPPEPVESRFDILDL